MQVFLPCAFSPQSLWQSGRHKLRIGPVPALGLYNSFDLLPVFRDKVKGERNPLLWASELDKLYAALRRLYDDKHPRA